MLKLDLVKLADDISFYYKFYLLLYQFFFINYLLIISFNCI